MCYPGTRMAMEDVAQDVGILIPADPPGLLQGIENPIRSEERSPAPPLPADNGSPAAAETTYEDGARPEAMIDHVVQSGFPWPVF